MSAPQTTPKPPRFRVVSGVNAGREFVAKSINFQDQTVIAFDPTEDIPNRGWLCCWSDVEFLHAE